MPRMAEINDVMSTETAMPEKSAGKTRENRTGKERKHYGIAGFTTLPPFITNLTLVSRVASCTGSSSRAIMSANFPGAREPTLSFQPIRSAALMVAA